MRQQRVVQVLKRASEKQALVEVALNTHGTRAVQKLIETLSSPEQVCFQISASPKPPLGALSTAWYQYIAVMYVWCLAGVHWWSLSWPHW